MKIKYNGSFNLSSVQKSFKGKDRETVYEVSTEDGTYLLKTFKDLFEEIKTETKQTDKETETKESPKKTTTKPKPRAKKTETEAK